jgi:hypothetical protein
MLFGLAIYFEKQTRTLILEYIAKPNSIILAVSPANVDLVNSELQGIHTSRQDVHRIGAMVHEIQL